MFAGPLHFLPKSPEVQHYFCTPPFQCYQQKTRFFIILFFKDSEYINEKARYLETEFNEDVRVSPGTTSAVVNLGSFWLGWNDERVSRLMPHVL